MPAQAADPQKQILPLVLTLALPVENAEPDQDHEGVRTDRVGRELNPSGAVLSGPKPPVSNTRSAAPDSSKDPSLSFAVNVVAPEEATKSGDQAAKPAQSAPSSANQQYWPAVPASAVPASAVPVSAVPVSPAPSSAAPPSAAVPPAATLPADATPPEPVAANPQEALQETSDSRSSSPSALAFAARMAAAPQTADTSIPGNPAQPSAASAPTPDRIPVRYAATAQITASAPRSIPNRAMDSRKTPAQLSSLPRE